MKHSINVLDSLLNKWWLRHLLFWLFVLNYYAIGFGFKDGKIDLPKAYSTALIFFPGFMMVVYPLLYFLIPQFLVKQKFLPFFLGFFLTLCLASLNTYFLNAGFTFKDDFRGFDPRVGKNIVPYIHIAGLATALKMVKFLFLEQRRTQTATSDRNKAELEFLKAQVQPHFLFNTMNNLFAHTLKNSPNASGIVERLSDLLRFMIYDSSEDVILLEQEISLLKNYTSLESLRYGDELKLSFHINGDIENQQIAPLILLPLVENSFKHGTSQQTEHKWITIQIRMEGDIMHFNIQNSYDPNYTPTKIKGKKTGIGLANVQKRLSLLYFNKHQLVINKLNGVFEVNLAITLHSAKPGKYETGVSANSVKTS